MARTFKVKNFEKFQHYKDRNPPWIRLYNTTLDNYDIGRLPDASKAHLFAIWLLASRYENEIPYDAEWIATKINATTPVDLEILLAHDLIEVSGTRSKPLARRKQVAVPEREAEESRDREDTPIAPKGASFGNDFLEFWKAYPEKVGKKAALKAWNKATDKPELAIVLAALESYKKSKPSDRQWCNPATWLNEGRYADERSAPTESAPSRPAAKDDGYWRDTIRFWQKTKIWPKDSGPEFGYGGCEIPAHIVTEFNLDGMNQPAFMRRTA